eukprot:7241410-Prymnesium_polylepis.1
MGMARPGRALGSGVLVLSLLRDEIRCSLRWKRGYAGPHLVSGTRSIGYATCELVTFDSSAA